VDFMCRMLGVSRAGYYAWRNRGPSAHAVRDAELTEKIREVDQEQKHRCGIERILWELQEDGLRTSQRRVRRLARAAGVECVSRGAAMTLPAMNPRLDGSDDALYNVYIPMGLTAENVAERCKVSRESQDEWAARSQQRAVAARESGHFDREIVGVDIPEIHDAGGDVIAAHTVTRDDGPRAGTTMEGLAKLKPVFKPGGTVTAGNACPLNDGAAAVLVMSEEKALERGIVPRARIVASAVAAIRPEIMGLAPIPAVRKVLKAAGMKIDDIDLVELNEAFAAQVLPCRDELGIDPEKLNINGGAIALGHPFGMTGARIMATLLNNLDSVGGRYGIEAMCVAGGLGQAMIVERLN